MLFGYVVQILTGFFVFAGVHQIVHGEQMVFDVVIPFAEFLIFQFLIVKKTELFLSEIHLLLAENTIFFLNTELSDA